MPSAKYVQYAHNTPCVYDTPSCGTTRVMYVRVFIGVAISFFGHLSVLPAENHNLLSGFVHFEISKLCQ